MSQDNLLHINQIENEFDGGLANSCFQDHIIRDPSQLVPVQRSLINSSHKDSTMPLHVLNLNSHPKKKLSVSRDSSIEKFTNSNGMPKKSNFSDSDSGVDINTSGNSLDSLDNSRNQKYSNKQSDISISIFKDISGDSKRISNTIWTSDVYGEKNTSKYTINSLGKDSRKNSKGSNYENEIEPYFMTSGEKYELTNGSSNGQLKYGSTNGGPPDQCDTMTKIRLEENKEESPIMMALQVFFPFLVAGMGSSGAGLLLDYIQYWPVFIEVSDLYIVIPTLLGMNGNLQMTLASRLSTKANLGLLTGVSTIWKIAWGNMALIQCQAIILGFLSSVFAVIMRTIELGPINMSPSSVLLIFASSMSTASTASFILGMTTMSVVIISYKCHINPDNVSTPIAASLGDITTLGTLAFIATSLFKVKEQILPSAVLIGILILMLLMWAALCWHNDEVKSVLFTGFIPVILAAIIASGSGFMLEKSISSFTGIAVFQPVINGVGGNLVAIQASRISTYLHKRSEPGTLPAESRRCISPFSAFFGKRVENRTAIILMSMVIPAHLIYGYSLTAIKGGDTALTPTFLPFYLLTGVLQVSILLYVAYILIHNIWIWKIDPDYTSIPLLTALGDILGTTLLYVAFLSHSLIQR